MFDIGAIDTQLVSKGKTLILEALGFGDKRRLVIDKHNNVVAEILKGDRWERMAWIIDASPLVGYALRRAICRGLDKAEVIETTDVVIIDLGEIKPL